MFTRFYQRRTDQIGMLISLCASAIFLPVELLATDSPTHVDAHANKPQPWPGGVVPYDVSKLTAEQQATVARGMQRWMDTGAEISFVPAESGGVCPFTMPIAERRPFHAVEVDATAFRVAG